MYSPDFPGDHRPVIAVIGGGASGTLAAVHLLRLAAGRGGLRVALIDRLGRHGLGQAYSTTHPGHLLNSPAATMSALAGDPGHLLQWARTVADADGSTGTGGAGAGGAGSGGAGGLPPGGFLERQAYGRYLRDLLATAERKAHPAATVRHITSHVVRISDGAPRHPLRLHLAADGHIDADAAVLATGNLPPVAPCPVPPTQRYIGDPWAPGALRGVRDGGPVVVLGTGLTAMDVAIAVTGGSRRTVVHAVSRHALLPQPHRQGAATAGIGWLPVLSDERGPVRLSELMWQVRTAMADRPGYWQDVVDSLRPYVPRLWRRLSMDDQRLFLRHVARYWEVHRHRMPPDTARRVTALRCARRLTVHAGRVTEVTEAAGGLRVRIEDGETATELTAGWLVNATGPNPDITTTSDPLLRDLFGRGLARPDPLRLGLDATPGGAVLDASGRPSNTIFALGPPLRGLRYETTAIPEIRDQAAALALRLTAMTSATARPISAA